MGTDASPPTDTSNMAKALRGEPVEITLPRLVEMREQAIAGATYTPGLPGWMHWHWVAALNEVIAKRAAPEPAPATTDRMIPESLVREFIGYLSGAVPELHRVEVPLLAKHWDDFKWTVGDRLSGEPAPATTDRVAPSFDAWWNDDAYGCLRYSDPVQFDRLRQAFNAGVAAARAAPEPDGSQRDGVSPAHDACVDIFNDFDKPEILHGPASIRLAWEVGRQVKDLERKLEVAKARLSVCKKPKENAA